jgi:hypothetical protein
MRYIGEAQLPTRSGAMEGESDERGRSSKIPTMGIL